MAEKKHLDEWSDFQERFVYRVPYVKFNGKEGKFSMLEKTEDDRIELAKELGGEIEGVFLRRGRFKLVSGQYFTPEVNPNRKEPITLYERNVKTGKISMIDEGLWKELKTRYGLKTIQLPYILLKPDNMIVKMKIIPGSLGAYWEYLGRFTKDERPYEVVTKFSSQEKEGKQGGKYYEMTFEKGEKVNLEEVEPYIKEVADNIQREEESRAETAPEAAPKMVDELKEEEDIPVVEASEE